MRTKNPPNRLIPRKLLAAAALAGVAPACGSDPTSNPAPPPPDAPIRRDAPPSGNPGIPPSQGFDAPVFDAGRRGGDGNVIPPATDGWGQPPPDGNPLPPPDGGRGDARLPDGPRPLTDARADLDGGARG